MRALHHGRLEVGAPERVAMPADDRLATLGDRIVDEIFDRAQGALIDQWALFSSGFESISNFELCDCDGEAICELLVDLLLYQQPVGAHAGLPAVAVFRSHRAGNGLIQIRIVEYDEWRVTAKLE